MPQSRCMPSGSRKRNSKMANWKGAVARLYKGIRGEAGSEYCGTAFMVSDRYMLTCFHVIRNLDEDDIRLYDVAAWRGGLRRVRSIHSNENVDVAVLELREPKEHADFVPVCRDQNITPADKYVECGGFSSEQGDLDCFFVKVSSFRGEYNLYVFPVPVGKGVSGAPVLYQNELVGISRLQDDRKTYLIPLRDFQDLLNEHVFPEGDKIETVLEPEGDLDGTKIPLCDFDSTIRNHIDELFVGEDLQKVAEEIFKLAGQDPPLMSIGEMLCSPNIEIESVVGWLNQAAAEVVQAMPRDVEGEQRRKAFKDTAEKILGWLVLRTVDPGWVEQHGSELLKKRGASLTVCLDYTSCVEVIVARTLKRECRFQSKHSEVQGLHAVGCLTTESGIEPAANTDALFKNVYHQVWRKKIIGSVTERHKKDLSRRLKNSFISGDYYYLTVPLDDLGASLTEKEFKNFHDQYPYLKLILLRLDDGESVLLIDDGDLYDLISIFFLRVIEEQA
ncbi:MAG: serine protease [Candidatus Electrothrix sp. AR3]|nr:serine protease [Candidatus Electrothrix sp. AR3]